MMLQTHQHTIQDSSQHEANSYGRQLAHKTASQFTATYCCHVIEAVVDVSLLLLQLIELLLLPCCSML